MSDLSVAGVDGWDNGADSSLTELADMTLEDLRYTNPPTLTAAVTRLLADLDAHVRYGGREAAA
jgi:hypothetical protein